MPEQEIKRFVLIVAGGVGARMNASIPKQFMKLEGKPILLWSINKFIETDPLIEIVIVLPAEHRQAWEAICAEYGFHKEVKIALSGDSRFHSVKNGLELIPDDCLVGIHDSVRPLVSAKTILATFKAAEMYGNAIPAIPINDSVRQIESTRNIAVDRSRYCVTQTPQCFRSELIKKAYGQEYKYTFTDDAVVLESMGEHIHLVDGNTENIKITSQKDLIIAEALLKGEALPHLVKS